ncbi:MAG: CopG family transcriptional regulator [Rhizobiaceae bacterium]
MRTTLDIAPDVLLAAKELAARGKQSLGEVISDLARKSLVSPANANHAGMRNGFPQLPATGQAVSPELIHSLLEDEF